MKSVFYQKNEKLLNYQVGALNDSVLIGAWWSIVVMENRKPKIFHKK